MTRKEILDTAEKMVNGSRQEDYGSAENNFSCIASMWRGYIYSRNGGVYVDIDAKDVAAMLILLKVARIASGHAKSDNWIDAAGYAACGGEIESNWEGKTECADQFKFTLTQDEEDALDLYRKLVPQGIDGHSVVIKIVDKDGDND